MASRLPGGAQDLLSRRSLRFRELQLAGRTFADDELLDLLAAEPKLLRKPIFVAGDRIVVGGAEEQLQQLLGDSPAATGGSAAADQAENGRTRSGR